MAPKKVSAPPKVTAPVPKGLVKAVPMKVVVSPKSVFPKKNPAQLVSKPTPMPPPEKKKKKHHKEQPGYLASWLGGIDTSAYLAEATNYYSAASSAVQGYASKTGLKLAGAEEEKDESEKLESTPKPPLSPPVKPIPVLPKSIFPKTVVISKGPVSVPSAVPPKASSGLARLFTGLGSSAKAPTSAVAKPPVPVAALPPKRIPLRPVPAILIPQKSFVPPPHSSDPITRVPPKRAAPVAMSAAELRTTDTTFATPDEDVIIARRDQVVQEGNNHLIMPGWDVPGHVSSLHPAVQARHSSDGDAAMGSVGLLEAAGVESPYDLAFNSGVDKIIASRQFLQAVKNGRDDTRVSEEVVKREVPLRNVFAPSLDNTGTVCYLPPARRTCAHCGFFKDCCICGFKLPKVCATNPLEAVKIRRALEGQPGRSSMDSPDHSDGEGEPVAPVNKSLVIRKPEYNSSSSR